MILHILLILTMLKVRVRERGREEGGSNLAADVLLLHIDYGPCSEGFFKIGTRPMIRAPCAEFTCPYQVGHLMALAASGCWRQGEGRLSQADTHWRSTGG